MAQVADEARSALSAEQAKTLKLETQVAELTEKLNSVQVRPGGPQGLHRLAAATCALRWLTQVCCCVCTRRTGPGEGAGQVPQAGGGGLKEEGQQRQSVGLHGRQQLRGFYHCCELVRKSRMRCCEIGLSVCRWAVEVQKVQTRSNSFMMHFVRSITSILRLRTGSFCIEPLVSLLILVLRTSPLLLHCRPTSHPIAAIHRRPQQW